MTDFLTRIHADIDAASIESAKTGKQAQKAKDEMLIAHASMSALQRRIREAEEVHTDSGACFVDRATGKEIKAREMERTERTFNDGLAAHTAAATIASQAAGRLNNLQKQRADWVRLGEYEASQRAAEAALSPAEREKRARRDAERRVLT